MYLGHVISESGIEVDPQKVEKIRDFHQTHQPEDRSAVSRIGVLVPPIYTPVFQALHALTRKNVKFTWTLSCQETFNKLKSLLTSGTKVISIVARVSSGGL